MEDITKYIGLLGFVPLILTVALAYRSWDSADKHVFRDVMKILLIYIFIVAGLIWGITTLGRLL